MSNLDVVDIFENVFDTACLLVIVSENKVYIVQIISNFFGPFTFYSRIRKWKMLWWMKCISLFRWA
jgi:hypothetical protein